MEMMFDRNRVTAANPIDMALYRMFPNYAGTVRNAHGEYPVSYLELSRPTGRYVSRFLMRELNLLIRKHSIVMIGNNCAPGYFFPAADPCDPDLFFTGKPESCAVFIANFRGVAPAKHPMVCFQAEPFMVLQIKPHWKQFGDYLNDMTSKYRIRTKKAFEKSSGLRPVHYSGEQIPEAVLNACANMLKRTLREKTLVINKNLKGILHRFAEHFGTAFRISVYFQGDSPAGFISSSIRNGTLHAWHLGYEPDPAADNHIYQRMLYDLVDYAIDSGCHTVNFGRTATEIKSTLGAAPVENYFMVYAKSRLLTSLLRYYQRRHFKPRPYILRNPFKSGH